MKFVWITAEHPTCAYTIHDLDDGNVQYRNGSPGEEGATADEPAECQLNDVLIGVSLGKNVMHSTHKIKTRPDRWSG